MQSYFLERKQWVAAPLDRVFDFFSNATNLELLTPPWLQFHIVTPTPIEMCVGTRIEYRIQWRVVSMRWLTEIVEWSPPHRFVDVQRSGPYRLWHHAHTFAAADGGTLVGDAVRYALPLGFLGTLAHRLAVRRDIERIFDFRAERIDGLLAGQSEATGLPLPENRHSPADNSR